MSNEIDDLRDEANRNYLRAIAAEQCLRELRAIYLINGGFHSKSVMALLREISTLLGEDIGRPVKPHGSGGGGDNLVQHLPPWYILVNGKRIDLPQSDRQLTYRQLVNLARTDPPLAYTERLFTITYAKGLPPRTEGIVEPGESVEVASGMIFDVVVTDRAS